MHNIYVYLWEMCHYKMQAEFLGSIKTYSMQIVNRLKKGPPHVALLQGRDYCAYCLNISTVIVKARHVILILGVINIVNVIAASLTEW